MKLQSIHNSHVYRKKKLENQIQFQPIQKGTKKNDFDPQDNENKRDFFLNNEIDEEILNTEMSFLGTQQNLLEQICDSSLKFENLVDILYKNYYVQGIHDFIVNKLYSLPDGEIEFFICDFVYWVIIREQSVPLEKFLEHRSGSSISMFLLIYWQLNAFSEVLYLENNAQSEEDQERIKDLLLKIESAMVKGGEKMRQKESKINQTITEQNLNSLQLQRGESKELLQLENLLKEKDMRSKYFEKVNNFITNLVDVSLTLKAMTKPQRKDCLTEYIERCNRYMNYLRYANVNSHIYHGISIPFARQYGESFSSSLIVQLVPKQFICFETRKRVPYRIVVETIDPEDLLHYKPRKNIENKERYSTRMSSLEAYEFESTVADKEKEEHSHTKHVPQINQSDSKQNKYKDLSFLEQQLIKEDPEQTIENIRNKQRKKSRILQIMRKSSQRHSQTRDSRLDLSGLATPGGQRNSMTGRIKNFLEGDTCQTPSMTNLKDQNIRNFHQQLKKKNSFIPDYENFRIQDVRKQQDSIVCEGEEDNAQKQSSSISQSSEEVPNQIEQDSLQRKVSGLQLKMQLSQNLEDNLQPIQESNFENSSVQNSEYKEVEKEKEKEKEKQDTYQEKEKETKKQEKEKGESKQKFVNKLSGERLAQYEKNIKRFNILFKPMMFMKNQIKRRFSFSDTSMKVVNKRKEEFTKGFQDYKKKKEIKRFYKVIKEKDLKIFQVLEFFKGLMKKYPQHLVQLQYIYKYLHYDLIESKLKQLGSEAFDDMAEFPRKFGPWGEIWQDRMQIIKKESAYGHFPSYKIRSIIIKGGDDLRQELICMQLIFKMQQIFLDAGLDLWLKPYEIIVTSSSSGIIEFLPNTQSIDGLKKQMPGKSLLDIYIGCFGEQKFKQEIQMNFVRSFAAYSIVSYFLQVKDRHNGNILIDSDGHMIHIDFGFIFSISPGNINFESAPYKFTKEYGELMGGQKSEAYKTYKKLVFEGMNILRKKENLDLMCNILEIMGEDSDLPCYQYFDIQEFRNRFKEGLNDQKFEQYVESLINQSYDAIRTVTYDWFQKKTNGILP